jgi:hypothetical protein
MQELPIPAEPMVMCMYLPNANNHNIIAYVPWKNCRLSYCYTVVTTVIDNNSDDMVLTLELNAAAGSTMASITIAKNSAVGTVDTPTLTAANCRKLDRDDSTRDAINVDVNGDSSASGAVMLYLYFESDYEV